MEFANSSAPVHVPKSGRFCRRNDYRAMRCEKALLIVRCQNIEKLAQSVWLEPTFDFIDHGQTRRGLDCPRDLKRCHSARSGPPTRKWKQSPIFVGKQTDESADRQTLATRQADIEIVWEAGRLQCLVKILQRFSLLAGEGIRHIDRRHLCADARLQVALGQKSVERGACHETQIAIIAIVVGKPHDAYLSSEACRERDGLHVWLHGFPDQFKIWRASDT